MLLIHKVGFVQQVEGAPFLGKHTQELAREVGLPQLVAVNLGSTLQ